MKRKKSTLTPCEEKALVTLQAQQIKEKEKKAKERAKKRKIDGVGRQILAGQSLPSMGTVGTAQTQPFVSFPEAKSAGATRNEWDQLIPMGLQTAQFMILNHAMNRQGQWNQPQREPAVVRQPRAPIIPPPPRDVPDISIVDEGIRLGGGAVIAPSGRFDRFVRGTVSGTKAIARGALSGTKAVARGAWRGTKAVGRGFVSGAKAIGRGATFVATAVGGKMTDLQREIEMTSIQRENNDILMDGRRVAGTKINQGVDSGPLTKVANAARKIKSKLSGIEMTNIQGGPRPAGNSELQSLFGSNIQGGPRPAGNIELQSLFGSNIQGGPRPAGNRELQSLFGSGNDLTQPNNQPNEIFNNMNKPKENVSSSQQNPSSFFTPKKPPKQPSESEFEIDQYGGRSPTLKVMNKDQNFNTKVVRGDNPSNTVAHLLENPPDYRIKVYNKTVQRFANQRKKGPLRFPNMGVDPYVKLDNMYYLNQKGDIVFRTDPASLHPDLVGSRYEDSRVHAGSLRLQNKQVVDYFNDPDNLEDVKQLYKQLQSSTKQKIKAPLPITNAHAVGPDGLVTYNSKVSYDPEASNEEFNSYYYAQPDVDEESPPEAASSQSDVKSDAQSDVKFDVIDEYVVPEGLP